ncbi:MAG: peptidase [Asticcacaulis sp.]
MRIPDRLFYLVVLVAIVAVTGSWHEQSIAPPAPPPPGKGEMALFANFTPFAAVSIINLPIDDQKVMTGTAFSIAKSGQWIMGADSIKGCPHPFLNIGGNLGVPFKVARISGVDNYVIGTTEGAGKPLPLADPKTIEPGQRGFMIGYPASQPGEATARLIGRTVIERHKRFQHNEQVMAWAQAGRTEHIRGNLNQLLGGPVVNSQAQVVGITLRESPRRGRIYSSTPETLARLASTAPRTPDFENSNTLTKTNYGIVADTLRREYRVAEVGCIKS